ncbi:hypothetical protein [Pontibacillus yanchengensis]|uniref:hypothetical protein n=1 Tax=Pontibacillus yanchengensis TaxID=462910 RepID=UPI001F3DCB4A|nr:hypothetical protein [Pontibacillus yanchengensis]
MFLVLRAISKLDLFAPIACFLIIVFYLVTDVLEIISLLGLLMFVLNFYNGMKEYQKNKKKAGMITIGLSFIILLLTFMNIFST